jgi:hypothetical protein
MCRRVFSFFVFAAMLGVSASAAEDLAKPSARGDVSIQFPKGWVHARDDALAASAPAAEKSAGEELPATIQITEVNKPRIDPAALPAVAGYQAIEKPAPYKTASGLEGFFIGGTFKGADGSTLRSRQYVISANNKTYIITMTALNSRWDGYEKLLEASAATFSVKP